MKVCKNCPAFPKCTVTYRSLACAAVRYTYGLESDPEIKTNADRIRAMSDEELAKMLYNLSDMLWCRELPECIDIARNEDEIPEEKCIGCALAWLQQLPWNRRADNG